MQSGWNLNVHYHDVILEAVPPQAATAIDVGCGDGRLTVDLAKRDLAVTALDQDPPSIVRTQASVTGFDNVTVMEADVLEADLEPESFDVVASIAMLHHIDAVQGIRTLRDLVAPGGVLVVIGFAKVRTPRELLLAAGGRLLKYWHRRRGQYWRHAAPISWPPPLTFASMEQLAKLELPGCEFRRLLSSRYALVWHAPRSSVATDS